MFLMDMVMPISSCPLALPRLTKKSQSSYEWFSWKAGKMWGLVLTLKVEYCLPDRKSTRLNSSHLGISYAVFCLKKLQRPPLCGQDLRHGTNMGVVALRTHPG